MTPTDDPPPDISQPKRGGTSADGGQRRRGRPPKAWDNTAVRQFAAGFWSVSDMARTYPTADDILSGALALKPAGDSATRPLSRSTLFHVLRHSTSISVQGVRDLFHARYSERTAQRYAEAARVASKALAACVGTVVTDSSPSRLADMQAIDAPFASDAAKAEALSLSRGSRPCAVHP